MRDDAAVDALLDEARAALTAALRAGPVPPPPSRARTAARNWAIAVGRLRDATRLRELGADHGFLSRERTRQVVIQTAIRWACAHVPGFKARWLDAVYGSVRERAPAWLRADA